MVSLAGENGSQNNFCKDTCRKTCYLFNGEFNQAQIIHETRLKVFEKGRDGHRVGGEHNFYRAKGVLFDVESLRLRIGGAMTHFTQHFVEFSTIWTGLDLQSLGSARADMNVDAAGIGRDIAQ